MRRETYHQIGYIKHFKIGDFNSQQDMMAISSLKINSKDTFYCPKWCKFSEAPKFLSFLVIKRNRYKIWQTNEYESKISKHLPQSCLRYLL